jgi:tetratricopeptide (TPR) repeat protein
MRTPAGTSGPAGRAASRAAAAALLAAAALSAACAGAPRAPRAPNVPAPPAAEPGAPSTSPRAFAALAGQFTDRALEQVRAGDLRRARAAWQAVAILRPEALEPRRQVEELTDRLAAEAERHYRDALTRVEQGDRDGARQELLLALLADPDHAGALEALRTRFEPQGEPVTVGPGDSFESIAQDHYGDATLAQFVARVNGLAPGLAPAPGTVLTLPALPSPAATGEPAPRPAEPPSGGAAPAQEQEGPQPAAPAAPAAPAKSAPPPAAASPAAPGPAALPPAAPAAPAPAEPSQQDKERAEELYNAGVRHFVNQNLDAAIQAWERALKLNPAHPNAAKDIEQARELQRKLREIR